jgi:predicted secreted protein
MSKIHGKSSFLQLTDAGDADRDVSPGLDSIEFGRSRETAETTGFSPAGGFKTFVGGLRDGTISCSGQWDGDANEIDAILDGLFNSDDPKAYKFGPEGDTAGMVSYTGVGFVNDYSVSTSNSGVVEVSFELQNTGLPVRGVFA